jgi:hypothetical protein
VRSVVATKKLGGGGYARSERCRSGKTLWRFLKLRRVPINADQYRPYSGEVLPTAGAEPSTARWRERRRHGMAVYSFEIDAATFDLDGALVLISDWTSHFTADAVPLLPITEFIGSSAIGIN